jgi:hypothetical protein
MFDTCNSRTIEVVAAGHVYAVALDVPRASLKFLNVSAIYSYLLGESDNESEGYAAATTRSVHPLCVIVSSA